MPSALNLLHDGGRAWGTWSTGSDLESALSERSRRNRRTPTDCSLAEPNPNAPSTNNAPNKPRICWTSTASTARTHHEIAGREALDRGRRPQDQRQPRRGVLEWHEGDFGTARQDAVRTGRRDRQKPPARQSVFRDTPLRA